MKKHKITAAALFVFFAALLWTPSSAQAMVVFGTALSSEDLITGVDIKTDDVLTDSLTAYNAVYGALTPYTEIVFSYNFWEIPADFDPTQWTIETSGFAGTVATFPWGSEVDGQAAIQLILSNLSGLPMDFSVYLLGPTVDSGQAPTAFIYSSSLAAVPLPAALPLFGLALLGLTGARCLKKAKRAA